MHLIGGNFRIPNPCCGAGSGGLSALARGISDGFAACGPFTKSVQFEKNCSADSLADLRRGIGFNQPTADVTNATNLGWELGETDAVLLGLFGVAVS